MPLVPERLPGRTRRRRQKTTTCGICEEEIPGKFRRHLTRNHLPWYFEPQHACWNHKVNFGSLGGFLRHQKEMGNCKVNGKFGEKQLVQWLRLMENFLYVMADNLKEETLTGLLETVRKQGWHPSIVLGLEVPVVKQELWGELDGFLGGCPTVPYRVDPPESVVALLHPNILQILLTVMDINAARELHTIEGVRRHGGLVHIRDVRLADSHCHLIPTLNDHCCNNVGELSSKIADWPGDYKEPVMICNISHAGCWKQWKSLVDEEAVYLVFGVHPLETTKNFSMEVLHDMLQHPKCVGVGECGLDTSRVRSKEEKDRVLLQQVPMFEEQLRLARENKLAVVIHVRGRSEEEQDELQLKAIGIMAGILQKRHPVHVHCFVGSLDMCQLWGSTFPNVKFGFTSKLESRKMEDLVHCIEVDRLMLETDAPFLTPQAARSGWRAQRMSNAPHFLSCNLDTMCGLLNLPPSIIGRITYQNCMKLYGLNVIMDP